MKLVAQFMAIGLAAALALSSTMACAMGGGGMAPGESLVPQPTRPTAGAWFVF